MPADAKLTFTDLWRRAGDAVATDSPVIDAARAALGAEYGRPAVLVGGGGSIPVVEAFKRGWGWIRC